MRRCALRKSAEALPLPMAVLFVLRFAWLTRWAVARSDWWWVMARVWFVVRARG